VTLRWRRWLGVAVVLVAIAAAFRLVGSGWAPSVSLAPRFVAQTLSTPAEMRSLDDYKGAPLLMNVWATWCDPCREEMPSLERLYREYRERGLRVVAISIDDGGQADLLLKHFPFLLARRHFPCEVRQACHARVLSFVR